MSDENGRTGRVPLEIAALGVVFGDIGTSTLYATGLAFKAAGPGPLQATVLGTISLIIWSLTLIVTIKYVGFVLRTDNHGEGGILALVARSKVRGSRSRSSRALLWAGLVGAALIIGDGMLTPAISVLSAAEGVEVVAPSLTPYALSAALAVLLMIFGAQRLGTQRISALFGPIMLIWFITIAVLGVSAIVGNPQVLAALSPHHGILLLIDRPQSAVLILGAAFLAVTGGEALYADLGHFGRQSISRAWLWIAMPALVLNYLGQGAHALALAKLPTNPFFELVPAGLGIPLVILATLATIIASQAIVTGAFSLTKQAIELGFLPPMAITYTSDVTSRHVYVGATNAVLGIGTLAITAAFGSSAALGTAYGIAVAGAMATTTVLFVSDHLRTQEWPMTAIFCFAAIFLSIDLFFVAVNLLKLPDGGWLPVFVAAAVCIVMACWRAGLSKVAETQRKFARSYGSAMEALVPLPSGVGTRPIVFLNRTPDVAPTAMSRLISTIGLVEHQIIIAHVTTSDRPHIAREDQVVLRKSEPNVLHAEIQFGYLDRPAIPRSLEKELQKMNIPTSGLVYVAGTERAVFKERPYFFRHLPLWLFPFLARNAEKRPDRFDLPSDRTLEIGYIVRL